MALIRKNLEKYNENKRDVFDMRKKVAWAVFSYINDETGEEFRKAFISKPFTPESEFFNIAPKII